MSQGTPVTRNWRDILLNRRMLICVFLGFTSGLPLYVLIQLIPAWLRTEGVDLATIGLFSLIALPFTWKFAWSPLLDRFAIPGLGRRRGWMLLTQVVLLAAIALLGSFSPQNSLNTIVYIVIAITIASASQDIAIDAYRRELLSDEELGTGNAIHVNAYRIASLVPGSLALILADHMAWQQVFWVTGSFMLIGIIMTLCVSEVSNNEVAPRSIARAVIDPFKEFISRNGYRQAFWVLLFMVLYKLGDNMATALETPFFIDQGFSLTEIGVVKKGSALWASIVGSIVAGAIMLKVTINRALWVFGAVQILSILGYAALALSGHSLVMLFVAVSFEYFGVGLGTVALTAFIAQQTNVSFAATQIALMTSLTAVPRTLANASTGFIIEAIGYFNFFLLCFMLAIPGMLLLFKVAPWNGATSRG